MTVSDCPIPKQNWDQRVRALNGAASPPAEDSAAALIEGAGPWGAAVQKILGFQKLADDWDGLGAKAPSGELLLSAIALAYGFRDNGAAPPHCVVPGLAGEVIFEWQNADGTMAEVEIDRPLHAEVMVIEPGKPAQHWTLPTD